ncbi:alpha/beta-hydrolase [Polychaeton citri CBS 116435]|uniref:Alpha/beta-hydrolase n=1 Tax=Polychaeton citri CBS 116435 TaxID=1314669 RepID=A0A9P4QDC3_9PEZI|nr:alpha/beta-hydrolase [Polychaeton citri CBS 116435]
MERRLSPPSHHHHHHHSTSSSYSPASTRRNVASYSSSTTTTTTSTTTTTTATAASSSPLPASGSAIASVGPDRLLRPSSPSPSPSPSHPPFSSSSLLKRFSQRPSPTSRTSSSTTTVTTSVKGSSRSHNSSQRASRNRSPNRVKTRPADPTVISGILSSLETLTPPGEIDPHHHRKPAHFYETSAGEVRPYPSGSTVASAPTVPRAPPLGLAPELRSEDFSADFFGESIDNSLASHGLFGDERGFVSDPNVGDEQEDDDDDDDAAAPPVILTSRPPSGLSHYVVPRPPSFVSNTSPASRQRRPLSINSRTSSGSVKQEKDFRNNKKLSAESWVKPSSKTDRSAALNGQASSRRSQSRELRRITSQETLRPDTRGGSENAKMGLRNGYSNGSDFSGEGVLHMTSNLSKAEEIIARAPPVKASSKGRLFLGDTTIDERQLALESPGAVITYPEIVDNPHARKPFNSPPEDILSTPGSSKRGSPARASPIVDSIPTRTSSLRQASRSPGSKRKKDRKLKKTMEEKPGKKSTWTGTRKVAIPESTWADLGEDDDTVKRIRQLREQRKERLRQSLALVGPDEVPYLSATVDPSQMTALETLVLRGEEKERPMSSDYMARQPMLEPSLGAQRPAPGSAGSHLPELSTRPSKSAALEPQKSPMQRPVTAATSTSAYCSDIPLDYSYTEAMDALQDLVGNPVTHTPPVRDEPNSLDLEEMNLKPGPPEMRSAPNSPHRNKREKRPPSSRWSTHPDLPLEFDRRGKNRRKSMSDARHARTLEEELEVHRRDSIDDAVMEYLRAPRLSQTVRHPTTGRTISFSEVGDPDGAAVLVCLGMGLTRYVTAFFDELAVTLRLRLITVERPGVGGSTPYPSSDRSGPLSWPDDVLAVCQHLGIGKFSLLAHSAGAIYALATALILPHLIRGKVQLLAPWIPPSQLEMISHHTASAPPAAALPRSQRILRVLPTTFLKAANSSFMTATSASLKPVQKRNAKSSKSQSREDSESPHRSQRHDRGHGDRPNMYHRDSMMMMDQLIPTNNPMENFLKLPLVGEESDPLSTSPSKQGLYLSATATPTDPNFAFASIGLNAAEHEERERKFEYTNRLTQRTWELATRDSNPATDLLVCLERHRQVGFRYTDVMREVVITHGSEDKRVPVANVRWLADQMNRRAAAALEGIKPPSSRDRWGDENPLATLNTGAGDNELRGGCEVRVLEGEGHGLMASPTIMGDVLTELAGAWIAEEGRGRLAI